MKKINRIIFIAIVTLIGGVGGFLYWYYYGCLDGTCALKSNAVIMTVYGLLIGLVFADLIPYKKKKE